MLAVQFSKATERLNTFAGGPRGPMWPRESISSNILYIIGTPYT